MGCCCSAEDDEAGERTRLISDSNTQTQIPPGLSDDLNYSSITTQAQTQKKKEGEEQARLEAEKKKKEAEERARQEEETKKKEAEKKAQLEEKKKKEAEEKALLEEKKKKDADEDNLLGAEIGETAQDKVPTLGNCEAV